MYQVHIAQVQVQVPKSQVLVQVQVLGERSVGTIVLFQVIW